VLLQRGADGSHKPFDATDTLDKAESLRLQRIGAPQQIPRAPGQRALQQAGLDVYQIDHEDANGRTKDPSFCLQQLPGVR
jgi:hypothetical protein